MPAPPDRHSTRPPPLTVVPDDPSRSRLFPRGTLVGLALLGLAAMAVMWPERQLARFVEASQDDRLAIQYLEQLLRLRRGDVQLRLQLARRYLHAGEPDAALEALAPLGNDPRADALRLGVYQRRWFDAQAQGKADEQAAAEAALRRLLARAAPPERFDLWRERLVTAQALGDAALIERTAASVERLLPLPPTQAREAVSALVGIGQYRRAAEVALRSLRAVSNPVARRELLMLAAQALLASGDAVAAYGTVAPLARSGPVDTDLAWSLLKWALAANRPGDARQWLLQAWPAANTAQNSTARLTPEQAEWAWRAALGGADLPLALRVADAVLANQASEEWARRRAQVLEWSNQPDAAMRQWMALLERHFSTEALEQLGRLATALGSGPGQIAYWRARERSGKLTAAEWEQYAKAVELQGDAREAVAVLRRGALQHPRLYGRMGWLLLAMGEIDEAKAAYARGLEAGALDLQAAMDDALLLIQTGAYEAALEVLERTRTAPGTEAQRIAHGGLRGDLAWDLGRVPQAVGAYRELWAAPALRRGLKPYQFQRFVAGVAETEGPAAALALIEQVWSEAPSAALAMQWLAALVKQPSLAGLEAWQRATASLAGQLERDAAVHAARAQVWLALKRPNAALGDLQQAVRLDPASRDYRVALMWLLLDLQRLDELRQQVRAAARMLLSSTEGQDLLAVAYQALNDLPRALALSARLYPRKRGDALWLINYGDLLTRANDGMRARAAYDRAWTLLQQAARTGGAAGGGNAPSFEQLLAALRLAKEPHDRVSASQQQRLIAALREKLRCTGQPVSCTERLPEQARAQLDAAIATWLVRLDTKDAARAWLAKAVLTQADRQSIELQIALAENDRQRVDELIDAGALRALTPIDRVEAFRVAGRNMDARAQAAEVLEETADRGQNSDAIEALMRDETQRRIDIAHQTGLRVEHRLNDVVRREGPVLSQSVTLTPQLKLTLDLGRWRLQSTNAQALTGLPAQAQEARVALQYAGEGLRAKLSVGRNEAVGATNPLSLEIQGKLPWGIQGDFQWHRNEVTEDSAALLVAGKADRVHAGVSKTVGRWWVQGGLDTLRYSTRLGAQLGNAQQADVQAGVWLRQGEPDIGLRASVTSRRSQANGVPEAAYARLDIDGNRPDARFFVPAGDDFVGVGLTINQLAADRYSRHWLPFLDAGWTQSRRQGGALEWTLGVQGPVVGADRLSLVYQRRRDAAGQSRQWNIQYRIWYGP